MSITPDRFSIRPHVYEALSSEFRPATDPENRPHTLGRLALATITRGKYTLFHEDESFDPVFTYRPSWAPDVTVQVTCEYRDISQITAASDLRRMEIASLDLTSESDDGVYISDETTGNQIVLRVDDSATSDGGIYYDLEHGTEMRDAKAAIAIATQRLFSARS